MKTNIAQTGFAVLCLVGLIAVATAAILEIQRAFRGESMVSRNQHRLRMLSAIVWMIILGSMSFTVLFLWPHAGDIRAERRFLSVASGIVLLFFIGLALQLYDVVKLSHERQRQERAFQQNLEVMAAEEVERLTHPTGTKDGVV